MVARTAAPRRERYVLSRATERAPRSCVPVCPMSARSAIGLARRRRPCGCPRGETSKSSGKPRTPSWLCEHRPLPLLRLRGSRIARAAVTELRVWAPSRGCFEASAELVARSRPCERTRCRNDLLAGARGIHRALWARASTCVYGKLCRQFPCGRSRSVHRPRGLSGAPLTIPNLGI